MEKTQGMNAVIRPLTENDAARFIDFFSNCGAETRYFFSPHDMDPEGLTKIVRDIPTNKNSVRFMAAVQQDDQEVMAGYVFFWDWQTQVPWFGIGLRNSYQGMGLGKKMIEFAIDLARKCGKGGILLTTKKTNFRAQGLYKSHGFEMIGEEPGGEYLMILRFSEQEDR